MKKKIYMYKQHIIYINKQKNEILMQKSPAMGVYGKARYNQIRRYSQIQNGLATVFKHSRERDFPRKPLSPECLDTLAREISPSS